MRFHHMCIVTSDLEKSIHLWRDVLGFNLDFVGEMPDGDAPGPDVYAYPALMDEIHGVAGSRARVAGLSSAEGAMIELMQPVNPGVEVTPPDQLRYRTTGIHELGLAVDDIDALFEKVRAAGYETQTEYVWPAANIGRTFIFYDDEGNMIQIWQNASESSWT